MKIRNPSTRFDIDVRRKDRVLEVGSGHNPHPRANVIVDKYLDDNTHRSGGLKILGKQQFVHADGERLPFRAREFDYVICSHVLEHVNDPHVFLQEQFRVARKGYIETPSLLGEYLHPKRSHKWVLLEIHDQLVLVEKHRIFPPGRLDFGTVFQDYFPRNSIGFKIMERTHPNMNTIRIEWEDSFDYIINPDDATLMRYFEEPWNTDMTQRQFPDRSLGLELVAATRAFAGICVSVIRSRILK